METVDVVVMAEEVAAEVTVRLCRGRHQRLFVLKQSDKQYKTAVLIAEQLSILQFRQDDQLGNATYYDCFTTRVEVACQAGVCYYSPDLLEDKATQLKTGGYDTLSDTHKKR